MSHHHDETSCADCADDAVVAVETKPGFANVWVVFESGARIMGSYHSAKATADAAAKCAATYGVPVVEVA